MTCTLSFKGNGAKSEACSAGSSSILGAIILGVIENFTRNPLQSKVSTSVKILKTWPYWKHKGVCKGSTRNIYIKVG